MTAENNIDPLISDMLKKQMDRLVATPTGLGRKEKRQMDRFIRKARKKAGSPTLGISEVHSLQPMDNLLIAEDVSVCKQELKDYEFAHRSQELSFELYRIFGTLQIPDVSIRAYYLAEAEGKGSQGALMTLFLQANPNILRRQQGVLNNFELKRKRLLKSTNGRISFDEDNRKMFADLIKHKDIPIGNIFRELLRTDAENIELLGMQIEWLQTPQSVELVSDQEVRIEEEQAKTEIEPENAKLPMFSLSNWDLYWTTNHWSQDPYDLISIPTTSREEALECFTGISRGEISVKPTSILRALEFHLQKSVIQRALATRNKYGPEGIRDWVKIKRGRDRIFFYVSEEESRAVFFAAGRDDVYKDI